MSAVLQRIEQTREALVGALAERNWEAIGELDQACRACMDDIVAVSSSANAPQVRSHLQQLLQVYQQLLDAASGERQAIVEQMSQVHQGHSAAKVYQLFT